VRLDRLLGGLRVVNRTAAMIGSSGAVLFRAGDVEPGLLGVAFHPLAVFRLETLAV
jgi:hypothetical protein